MPSLSALNEFRDSFSNIANEREDLESRNLPYSPPDLPVTEAPPFEPPARQAAAADSAFPADFFDNLTGGGDDAGEDGETADTNDTPDASAGAGIGNFDFSAFLNSVPEDIPPPPDVTADIPSQPDESPEASFDDTVSDGGLQADAAPADDALLSTDDFLNSLGGDTPSDETSADETSADETPSDDAFPSTDDFLNSLGGDTPSDETSADETSADEPPASEAPAEDDFAVPTDLLSGFSDEIESAPSDFPAGDIPAEEPPAEDIDDQADEGFDLGGERQDGSLGTEGGAESFMPSSDTSGGDEENAAPETDISADIPSADFDLPADMEIPSADFDLPADTETPSADFDLPADTETPSADFDLPADMETPSADFDLPETDIPSADFDLPADTEAPPAEGVDLGGEAPHEEPIDLGGEAPPEGESGLGDFDLPGMDEPEITPTEDLGLDDQDSLPDTGVPDGTEFPQTESDDSLPDMDFDTAETPAAGDSSGDSNELLNMADFGDEFSSESIELENEPQASTELEAGGAPTATFSDDDFALPGLDEIFEKTKVDTTPKPAPKKSFFKRKKEEEEEESLSEDSDEIRLSQEDLDQLMATLESYPLNLRIACEELIAEQVILPQQLSKLLRMLIRGAHVKEMAEFAGSILGKEIVIPRSYEKSTGAEWEAEKSSFAYIFVHNFLPVLRIFALAGALLVSTGYLCYKFIYLPVKAESLYKRGYERIGAGEYQRANELFQEASNYHRKKKWYYKYAEGFRDQRRYLLAENKYDELLRFYHRDKKGVLDYANLETNYLLNYEKANKLLQHELLDYAPDDYDGLLAAGDNFLAWADSDPAKFYDKYEEARFCYARILQKYGWTGPVLERMLLYFMHTDNLKETLNLRAWFENNTKKYKLTTPTLAELGGYLLDKQLEKPKGVPNAYVESIESVRDMLLQAVKQDNLLPEPHYHLARYYKNLGNVREERLTLENAIRAYDLAKTESVRRRLNRVDTHYRYANLLINNKEFFPAEEQLVRGIELYEDFVSRNLISPTPQLGRLYAGVGDLEYFVKSGNIQAALNNYHTAEKYGYAPPEIQYRMGAAYYQQEKWGNALDYLYKAASELPQNRRILFALGNATFKRGDYFAAQGYYNRLLDILENQRVRLPVLLPNDNPQFLELGERLMMARNNAGVTYEALAKQTGRREYRSKALSLYADSARSWDAITRNPQSMTRMSVGDTPGAPGINLGYLNANNALHPSPGFTPEIFIRIDRDVSEPSHWEELAPFGGLLD